VVGLHGPVVQLEGSLFMGFFDLFDKEVTVDFSEGVPILSVHNQPFRFCATDNLSQNLLVKWEEGVLREYAVHAGSHYNAALHLVMLVHVDLLEG
jgi:hypothetical protein